jgi:hypothetical protein
MLSKSPFHKDRRKKYPPDEIKFITYTNKFYTKDGKDFMIRVGSFYIMKRR